MSKALSACRFGNVKPRTTFANEVLVAARISLPLLTALTISQVFFPTAMGQVKSAATSPTVSDKIAIVRHAPILNGGRVDGSLWQLNAENLSLTGTATITSDLLVPGVPTISTGNPTFGLIECVGDSQPSGYVVRL